YRVHDAEQVRHAVGYRGTRRGEAAGHRPIVTDRPAGPSLLRGGVRQGLGLVEDDGPDARVVEVLLVYVALRRAHHLGSVRHHALELRDAVDHDLLLGVVQDWALHVLRGGSPAVWAALE